MWVQELVKESLCSGGIMGKRGAVVLVGVQLC